MRLVQLALPADRVEPIMASLDEAEIDYVVTEDVTGERYDKVISFAVPIHAVEGILDDLRKVGLTDEARTIIIDVETVISGEYDELRERLKPEEGSGDQLARQELRTRAEELSPAMPIYVTMTLISAIVATAGLLMNSPAVVVGSMVIAPLIGPALAGAVGTVVNDEEMFHSGILNQFIGVGVAIVGAALFAWLLRMTLLVPPGANVLAIPEVAERLAPDLLTLFIALGAGIAGILSLTTGVSTALVGVMIAAALIPPAGAAGVALAWGEPAAAVGALVLVFVNLISINLAGLVTLWYTGYRPEAFFETSIARRQLLQQVGLYGVAVTTLSSFLVASTYTAIQQARFETNVQEAVDDVLSRDAYERFDLLDVRVSFGEDPLFAQAQRVVIEVGSESGERHPDLPGDLQAEIIVRTDRQVTIRVRFVQFEERR